MSFLYSLIDKLSYFKVKLNDENSKVPAKAESGSAGYDVFSVENCVIEPSQRKLVSIGISIEIPRHCYLRCAPRSGLSCKGIDIGAGVIDASYRGTIKVLMINNSKEEYIVSVGDKIAQLIMERCLNVIPTVVTTLSDTERGEGGFGSTDVISHPIEHNDLDECIDDIAYDIRSMQILDNEIIITENKLEEPLVNP